MRKLCVYYITILCLFLCLCDGQIRMNCPGIRHNILTAHKVHRCLRNIRVMLRFICHLPHYRHQHGSHIRRNPMTEEERTDIYCHCCTHRCNRQTLQTYCH